MICMAKKDKGIDLNSNIVAGILSIMFLVLEIIGIFVLIFNGRLFGVLDIVILIAFVYVFYKTIIKRKS